MPAPSEAKVNAVWSRVMARRDIGTVAAQASEVKAVINGFAGILAALEAQANGGAPASARNKLTDRQKRVILMELFAEMMDV